MGPRNAGIRGRFDSLSDHILYFLPSIQWIAERYHRSTPENFWEEFRDEHGHKLSSTVITTMLRKQRTEANSHLVQQQQEQLGPKFSQQYNVRGKAMVRASAIAKHIGKNGQL